MASLKEVRGRIQSVSSTQQITKAMKMVSAAKLRRAQEAVTRLRPYAQRLTSLLANVTSASADNDVNEYAQAREVRRVLIVAITSDRGLAGAFNSNVFKGVNALIAQRYGNLPRTNITVMPIGKKANDYYARRDLKRVGDYSHVFSRLSFDTVRVAAEEAMHGFVEGQYDEVVMVYNEFKNVATQVIQAEQLLPLVPTAELAGTPAVPDQSIDYIFEPSKDEIIRTLLPLSLKTQFYKAVLESNASEHGARMTAMDKATDNAGELLKSLKLTYNRTRQAAITTEILEIVGGAEALAAG